MSLLITSDLHFTNHIRDAYRWDLFPWIVEQIDKFDISHIFILGDITDAKDRHSSQLVNRLCDGVRQISERTSLYILKGNHDFTDQNTPFFGFLRGYNGVRYLSSPATLYLDWGWGQQCCLCLPAVKDHRVDWPDADFKGVDYIFAHATFMGAEVENGTKIGGIPLSYLDGFEGICISGDVHVPQRLGTQVIYVGSPYHVHFGDNFNPRLLLIGDDGGLRSLRFDTLHRPSLTIGRLEDLRSVDVFEGDQVKIRVQLLRSDYASWPALRIAIREYAVAQGWDLCGLELLPFADQTKRVQGAPTASVIDPRSLVREHAKRKKLAMETCEVGISLVSAAI